MPPSPSSSLQMLDAFLAASTVHGRRYTLMHRYGLSPVSPVPRSRLKSQLSTGEWTQQKQGGKRVFMADRATQWVRERYGTSLLHQFINPTTSIQCSLSSIPALHHFTTSMPVT